MWSYSVAVGQNWRSNGSNFKLYFILAASASWQLWLNDTTEAITEELTFGGIPLDDFTRNFLSSLTNFLN